VGGSVVLTLHPTLRRSWLWACVVGADRPLVAVYEDEAPMPGRGTLELRTSGLWVDIECALPFEHVTVGMEAFGLAFEDPQQAVGSRRGDRTPVGFDLEWESEPDDVAVTAPGCYRLACRVHGEILVGAERIELDGWGCRDHVWGTRPWWTADWSRVAGRAGDGSPIGHTGVPDGEGWTTVAQAPVVVPTDAGPRLDRVLARRPGSSSQPDVAWMLTHRA
jgi:hypothetical protein